MRDTSMEDLAQSTEVLAALEVARARSQDAAESVADLSDFSSPNSCAQPRRRRGACRWRRVARR